MSIQNNSIGTPPKIDSNIEVSQTNVNQNELDVAIKNAKFDFSEEGVVVTVFGDCTVRTEYRTKEGFEATEEMLKEHIIRNFNSTLTNYKGSFSGVEAFKELCEDVKGGKKIMYTSQEKENGQSEIKKEVLDKNNKCIERTSWTAESGKIIDVKMVEITWSGDSKEEKEIEISPEGKMKSIQAEQDRKLLNSLTGKKLLKTLSDKDRKRWKDKLIKKFEEIDLKKMEKVSNIFNDKVSEIFADSDVDVVDDSERDPILEFE